MRGKEEDGRFDGFNGGSETPVNYVGSAFSCFLRELRIICRDGL